MISRGLELRRSLGVGRALRELKESGGVPSGTDAFLETFGHDERGRTWIRGGTRGSRRGPASSVRVPG
jgi:hypothetical protein